MPVLFRVPLRAAVTTQPRQKPPPRSTSRYPANFAGSLTRRVLDRLGMHV